MRGGGEEGKRKRERPWASSFTASKKISQVHYLPGPALSRSHVRVSRQTDLFDTIGVEKGIRFMNPSVSISELPTQFVVNCGSNWVGCHIHILSSHNHSWRLFFNHRIGWSVLKWCEQLPNGTLKRRRASASNCRITPIAASSGTSCAQRNTNWLFSLGVTLSLGRQVRTRSTNNASKKSRNGSNLNRDWSLGGHSCRKSAARRILASKRPTQPSTERRLAQVWFYWPFITGNSSLEPLLEGLLAQIHVDMSWWGFG